MTDALDRVITATTLRTAIRAKVNAGISRQTISQLVSVYASPDAGMGRDDGTGVRRLPVEVIAHDRRRAFLAALDRLHSDGAPDDASATDRLAG